jgi:hypothetical protein
MRTESNRPVVVAPRIQQVKFELAGNDWMNALAAA